jgi:hypothetical protein
LFTAAYCAYSPQLILPIHCRFFLPIRTASDSYDPTVLHRRSARYQTHLQCHALHVKNDSYGNERIVLTDCSNGLSERVILTDCPNGLPLNAGRQIPDGGPTELRGDPLQGGEGSNR